MTRIKKGVHYFPNKRALLSILPRVNSDMSLSPFYSGLATQLASKPITLDGFMEHWDEQARLHAPNDEWFDYLMNNVESYIKALTWHHNPLFAATLISRYQGLLSQDGNETVRQPETVTVEPPKPVGGIVIPEESKPVPMPAVSPEESKPVPMPAVSPEESKPVPMPAPSWDNVVGVDEAAGDDMTVVHEVRIEPPPVADDEQGEAITEDTYQELLNDVRSMKLSDLHAFAELYGIELGGKRRKAEVRDAIITALESRVE